MRTNDAGALHKPPRPTPPPAASLLILPIPLLSLFPLNDIATLNLSAAQSYLSGGRMQLAIGVSAVAAAGYSSRTGRGPEKVRVVKNAIDNEGWGRAREQSNSRVRVGTLSRLTYR